MSLPTIIKTWQYSVNTATAKFSTNDATILRTVKNSLLGFPTNSWTVEYSCNSSIAGTPGDGVDRWAADSNVVWGIGANPRSWIVLKQTGIASNFQLMIECFGTSQQIRCRVSPSAGFTGGSTTTAPTATDQIAVTDTDDSTNHANFWYNASGNNSVAIIHALQSTDGQCTRVFITAAGSVFSTLLIETLTNTVTGWTLPWAFFWNVGAGYGNLCNTTTASMFWCWSNAASTRAFGVCTVEGGSFNQEVGTRIQQPNSLSSEWFLCPMGFFSPTTSFRGRHGTFFDYYGCSVINHNGDGFPGDPTRQFMVFGNTVVPWNNSVLKIS